MKYKTAFRLALRLIGVLVFAQCIPDFLYYLAGTAVSASRGYSANALWFAASATAPALGALLGLYLFFGGRWIIDRAIPSNRPYCVECSYELAGHKGAGVCPECGLPYQLPDVPLGLSDAYALLDRGMQLERRLRYEEALALYQRVAERWSQETIGKDARIALAALRGKLEKESVSPAR